MIVDKVVSWDHDVFPAWRRAANNAPQPNSDVWGKLPPNMHWSEARVEKNDIHKIYIIGSYDWIEVFGTYSLTGIASQEFNGITDKYKRHPKILEIEKKYAQGCSFEPIIMVSLSVEGPFVLIDGNNRAVAMQRQGILIGKAVFLGLHSDIGKSFMWYRNAVEWPNT